MRRLATVFFVLMMLVTLTGIATGAETVPPGTEVTIAVPDHIGVDGSLDLVVFTKRTGTHTSDDCFAVEEYPVYSMVILDHTAGVRSLVTGVMATVDLPSGVRVTDLMFDGTCTEADGTSYRKYIGVTS